MKGTPQRLLWRIQDNVLTIHVNKNLKSVSFNRVIDGIDNLYRSKNYSIVIEIGRAFLLPVCRQGTINRIIEEIMSIVFGSNGSHVTHVDVINMDEMEKETKKTEETVG